MNTDPIENKPSKAPAESLEDAIYSPTLAEGNAAVRHASAKVTIPVTLAIYLLCGGAVWYVARTSKTVQKALKKTVGIDLSEQKDLVEAPPPPPAPPAPPPAAPSRPVEKNDAPPPPPLTNQDAVPELAPKELPKEDLSLRYATAHNSTPGAKGAPTTASYGSGTSTQSSGTGKVVDFDLSEIETKYQPPLTYPPMAKIAKIQGTVVVQITIDPQGKPIKATATEGPAQLRPPAEHYAMQWRFQPAMLNGTPQYGRFKLTITYKLR